VVAAASTLDLDAFREKEMVYNLIDLVDDGG
jgi:hypothetical protein